MNNQNQDQNEFLAINIDQLLSNINSTNNTKKKKLICIGLQSAEISDYIKQTSTQFGDSYHIKIITCNAIRAKSYTEVAKDGNICHEYSFIQYNKNCDLCDIWNTLNNKSENQQENPWIILADKAIKGAFKDMLIFTGLCEVMRINSRVLELFRQNLEDRLLQSIQHLRKNNEDYLTNPELCYENVARFKRLADTINYNRLILAMTDNTKLKS
ncbi:hypothetical protein GLOIN_2v1760519 [Rhizophagus clarus]|uniref:Uncharacterized protein n=1 Tax=Rhizophagus clarus TaxID=94130 RepID=A0A8H3LK07_9GLOM|nr:hypothetical protein GLOIN_2v1760519 [Rhizophagus clarus]